MSGMLSSISLSEATARMQALYGVNKKIADGNYDKSLAVKCVNGTFVGKKTQNIIAYKGIPFVGRQFDKVFSRTMRKMWVQFAKTGNPSLSADISPDGKAREWPLYDIKDKYVMVLDEFNIRAEKESTMHIVDCDRTYFLTKYYVR